MRFFIIRMRVVFRLPVTLLLTPKTNFHRSYSSSFFRKKMSERKPFERLPKDVLPSNYALRLTPNLTNFTFEGIADITVQVQPVSGVARGGQPPQAPMVRGAKGAPKTSKPTRSVILNCLELKVDDVKFKGKDQSFEGTVQVEYSAENETVTLVFPEELKVGEGQLSMSFVGQLNDKLKGFYRSKYLSPEGEERYGAVTQFEPTDARQAFPCWDEPAIKATFDITLVVPKNRVALSNMPVEHEEDLASDSSLKVVKFARTLIMPTYLLAYVIGEYDFVEKRDSDGVLVRVYTPVGKKEQGNFALDVAVKTLPFYNNYFNIAYPLPKMDLIAIADFAAGAMENWGLVTYRETALLIDEANSSAASKQRVALVVGHEIAHQWFGNLVTMEWWTHLWLNEGFASWIEYLCVDHCFPEFDIWTQFASSDFSEALNLDALKSSHPIEVAVGHPSEIDEIFDSISYCKGASVIRMLHDYIGDEDYRKGMNIYLSRHKYTNTFTEDLWAALGEASGKPIEAIMSTWTKQIGFPVIKVSQKIEGDNRILSLKQERFIADGSHDDQNQLWMVPISICTASSPNQTVHSFIFDKSEETITVKGVAGGDWLKLNVGGVGFYRTHYPADMLESLLPAIRNRTLSPRDRLALENDLFALLRAGVANAVDVLKLAEAFQNETSYTVWTDLNSNLSALSILYQYTDFHDKYRSFLRKLFTPVMAGLGWEAKDGEGPLTAMLRSLVISRLGRSDATEVVDEAKKRFAAHCDGTAKLSGDLRNAVYGIVLKYGDVSDYEAMLKLYRGTDLQEEKVRILRSLGSVTEPTLIQRTLDFSMSDEVRSQDTVFGITGVTGTVEGRELAWNFVKTRWSELHERYSGGFLLSRLVKATTEDFVTEEKALEIDQFFRDHPAPSAERNIQQSLENIRLNVQQLNRDRDSVKSFLSSF